MKKTYIAYTMKDYQKYSPVWTMNNTLNFCALFQKTKEEAMIRYDTYLPTKVKITIETLS